MNRLNIDEYDSMVEFLLDVSCQDKILTREQWNRCYEECGDTMCLENETTLNINNNLFTIHTFVWCRRLEITDGLHDYQCEIFIIDEGASQSKEDKRDG